MPYAKGDAEWAARVLAFKQEFAKLGWTDGGNIAFDVEGDVTTAAQAFFAVLNNGGTIGSNVVVDIHAGNFSRDPLRGRRTPIDIYCVPLNKRVETGVHYEDLSSTGTFRAP